MDENANKNKNKDTRYRLFLKLFRENEGYLFGFIMKLLPNFAIAEDIMQETMMIMWQKFDDFQEGTSFIAWAKQIARYKVVEYVRKSKRRSMVHFSDNTVEELANQEPTIASQNTYFEAMHNCIDKLKNRNREIIQLRYTRNMKIKEVAELMDMTSNALSKHMARIHYSLKKCIDRTLHAWDITNG